MPLHFGVLYLAYTPAVEAQLVRDIIAMQSSMNQDLVCCCAKDDADRVLQSFNIRRLPADTIAKLWIVYKTNIDDAISTPEFAETTITRDLFLTSSSNSLQIRDNDSGYFLPEPGRAAPARNFVMPTQNTPTTDPAVLFLWT